MNDIRSAQDDMRAGYFSGGAGILASSLAWLAPAFVASRYSTDRGRCSLAVS
jgi:hypothetical protein